jgi:DNA-directed RNA polymerase subunit RPC12/RpoP
VLERGIRLGYSLAGLPTLTCPACSRLTPRRLDETSKDAYADYYRCEACGHVWSVNKKDPTLVHHVTPLPEKPPPDK